MGSAICSASLACTALGQDKGGNENMIKRDDEEVSVVGCGLSAFTALGMDVCGGLEIDEGLAGEWSVAGRIGVMVEGVSRSNTEWNAVIGAVMHARVESEDVPASMLCVAAARVGMEFGAGLAYEWSNLMHARVEVEILASRCLGWGGGGLELIAALCARAELMIPTDQKSVRCGNEHDGGGWLPVVGYSLPACAALGVEMQEGKRNLSLNVFVEQGYHQYQGDHGEASLPRQGRGMSPQGKVPSPKFVWCGN